MRRPTKRNVIHHLCVVITNINVIADQRFSECNFGLLFFFSPAFSVLMCYHVMVKYSLL